MRVPSPLEYEPREETNRQTAFKPRNEANAQTTEYHNEPALRPPHCSPRANEGILTLSARASEPAGHVLPPARDSRFGKREDVNSILSERLGIMRNITRES